MHALNGLRPCAGAGAVPNGSRPSRWCSFPNGLWSWSDRFCAENGVCLVVVDLDEGLDCYEAAGGLRFVVLLGWSRAALSDLLGERHVSQDVMLAVLHHLSRLGPTRTQWSCHLAPCCPGCCSVWLVRGWRIAAETTVCWPRETWDGALRILWPQKRAHGASNTRSMAALRPL